MSERIQSTIRPLYMPPQLFATPLTGSINAHRAHLELTGNGPATTAWQAAPWFVSTDMVLGRHELDDADKVWGSLISHPVEVGDARLLEHLLVRLDDQPAVVDWERSSRSRKPVDAETELLLYDWAPIIAALAHWRPSHHPGTLPKPSMRDLEYRRRHRRDGTKRTRKELSRDVDRMRRRLDEVATWIDVRVEESIRDLDRLDSSAGPMTAAGALRHAGFPAAVLPSLSSTAVVAVLWPDADEIAASYRLDPNTGRLRPSTHEERHRVARQSLVRYFSAIARLVFKGWGAPSAVHVLAVNAGRLEANAAVVAEMTLTRSDARRLESDIDGLAGDWEDDWLTISADVRLESPHTGSRLRKFIERHRDQLAAADTVVIDRIGPLISMGATASDGQLRALRSLDSVVDARTLADLVERPLDGSFEPVPLFGHRFWLDISHRSRLYDAELHRRRVETERRRQADEAARLRAARGPDPTTTRRSLQSRAPEARKRPTLRSIDPHQRPHGGTT